MRFYNVGELDKRHPSSIALQTTIGDLIDSFEYDADYEKYKDYVKNN